MQHICVASRVANRTRTPRLRRRRRWWFPRRQFDILERDQGKVSRLELRRILLQPRNLHEILVAGCLERLLVEVVHPSLLVCGEVFGIQNFASALQVPGTDTTEPVERVSNTLRQGHGHGQFGHGQFGQGHIGNGYCFK